LSSAPELTKSNWNALNVIQPTKTLIVIPINTCYEIKENVWVTGLENVREMIN
jgi:hypothetical protein